MAGPVLLGEETADSYPASQGPQRLDFPDNKGFGDKGQNTAEIGQPMTVAAHLYFDPAAAGASKDPLWCKN
jgi:hypothetical protein